MLRHLRVFASTVFLSLTLTAHADTITNYTISGTLLSGGIYAGTIKVDAGQFTTNVIAVDVVAAGVTFNASIADILTLNPINGQPIFQNGDGAGYPYAEVEVPNTYESLYLLFWIQDGLNVCTKNAPCNKGDYSTRTNSLNFGDPVTSGTLSEITAIAPEPSSLLLLGTGLAGMAGLARRRFKN